MEGVVQVVAQTHQASQAVVHQVTDMDVQRITTTGVTTTPVIGNGLIRNFRTMMKTVSVFILGIMLALPVQAHEMVPTYPRLEQSHMDGLLKATMKMFNKRADVEYYEVGVFDKDFQPVPFVTAYNVFKLEYLSHTTFDIYIRAQDRSRAVYVCSRSKLRKDSNTKTAISSKICSRFKDE